MPKPGHQQRDVAVLVTRTRAGDLQAFAEIVHRFHSLVASTAFGWLGDQELARDVSQEVFLDAHLHLDQLHTPDALAGWLKQIARKHCDRITRRRAHAAEVIGALPPAVPSQLEEPSKLLQAENANTELHRAIAALPEHQRVVVALYYLADLGIAPLADFLELPQSTVKKRLHDARQKLRGVLANVDAAHDAPISMPPEERTSDPQSHHTGAWPMSTTPNDSNLTMTEPLTKLRTEGAAAARSLSEEVLFFIALRAGDQATVRTMIQNQPALADAEQNWDPQLAHDGVLPFPNKATALITAVEQDDLAMLNLLLELGADPEGRCGCATAESPLWAATLFNRTQHAAVLLAKGADPDVVSASGNRPIHLAAMRGHADIVELLIEHGADPHVVDAGASWPAPSPVPPKTTGMVGSPPTAIPRATPPRTRRTPADWAHRNGFTDLAQRLSDASHAGTDADDMHITRVDAGRGNRVLHTGIKALDLFAPLPRGGLIRFPFVAGVGMMVLLSELSFRFAKTPGCSALWTGFTQPPFDRSDFLAEIAETGIGDLVSHSLASFQSSPETRRAAWLEGLAQAEARRDAGEDVLCVVTTTPGFEHDVEAAFPQLTAEAASHEANAESGSITTVIMTPFHPLDVAPKRPAALNNRQPWTANQPPFAAQFTLQRARAEQRLLPAFLPEKTLSNCLVAEDVGAAHVALAERARGVLAAYELTDPDFSAFANGATAKEQPQADALLRYFCQPFHIAEPFTGAAGESVAREQLLADLVAIL